MSISPETPRDPTKSLGRRVLRIAQRYLVYYLGLVLVLSFFQRRLMYVPTTASALPVSLAGGGLGTGEDISFRADDGLELHGWHLLPAGMRLSGKSDFDRSLADSSQFVILFFPGNGGNRRHRDVDFQLLTRLPAHVIAFDYRGYGENPGHPSEAKFARDAQAAWKYVTETRHVPAERVLIYGESLGGGVATRLASELCLKKTPPGGLILCSTFSSMVDAASHHYPWLPVRLILKDRYPSNERIQHLTAPLLMLHGQRDRIVPYQLGRRLFDAAPEKSQTGIAKTFVDLPKADHNDILFTEPKRYQDGLVRFLRSLRK
jgi:pimeloyl-ACP methyl ester carboxylesterase